MAKGAGRAEVADRNVLLERNGRRDDFTINGRERVVAQRAVVDARQLFKDFLFAAGDVDVYVIRHCVIACVGGGHSALINDGKLRARIPPRLAFGDANRKGSICALIKQLHNLVVQAVNARPQRIQVHT